MSTYVMSDIHGNSRRFQSIMNQIKLQPEDTLYVLGDVIDRFPDGIRILKQLMKMPNVKMLLGNHEHMMLDALGEPYRGIPDDRGTDYMMRLWYRNGGDVTHEYWKRIRKDVRREVLDYLHSLPLEYRITVHGMDYRLVHGAPEELYERYGHRYANKEQFAVWKRWDKYAFPKTPYIMVFGHTPTNEYDSACPMEIWYDENKIGIDCGSGWPDDPEDFYYGFGRLACLRLEDAEEFYSEEPDNKR